MYIILPGDQTTCVLSCKSLDLLISWWIYARPNPVTKETRFHWTSCLVTYLFVFFAGSENQHLHCCLLARSHMIALLVEVSKTDFPRSKERRSTKCQHELYLYGKYSMTSLLRSSWKKNKDMVG